MLGLKNKETSTTIQNLLKQLKDNKTQLVGVRIDNDYIKDLRIQPALFDIEYSDYTFSFTVILKPEIPHFRDLLQFNSYLIDSDLGSIDINRENRELTQEYMRDLLTLEIENEPVEFDLNVSIPNPTVRETKVTVGDNKLTLFNIEFKSGNELESTHFYFAFMDKQYDSMTFFTPYIDKELTRLDTLKVLKLMSDNNLFGYRLITARYDNNTNISVLNDVSLRGMGFLTPDLNQLDNFSKFIVYSGDSELYLNHSDIKKSSFKTRYINKERTYELNIDLKNGNLSLIFE